MERLGPEPTEGKDVINPIKVAGSLVSPVQPEPSIILSSKSGLGPRGSTPRRMRGATRPIMDAEAAKKDPPLWGGAGCDTVVPFMNQTPTLPRGVDPENIAHAVAVVIAGFGNVPGGRHIAEHRGRHDLVPFISQMPTLPLVSRQRMSVEPLPSKSPMPAIFQVSGTDTEVYRLDDLGAVHHPHADLAGRGVVPEDVALAVGSGDGPGGRHVADDRRLHDRRAVHEPDADIAAGVAPQNVADSRRR